MRFILTGDHFVCMCCHYINIKRETLTRWSGKLFLKKRMRNSNRMSDAVIFHGKSDRKRAYCISFH